MEQRGLDTCGTEIANLSNHGNLNLAKNDVNSFWNYKITFCLQTSGGKNSNQCKNVVHFFNASVI